MIYAEDHLAQHHLFRLKNTKLNHLYTLMSIRSFIISLVNIFIPIYLYELTYSLKQILIFELIMFAVIALLEYPALRLIAHFGSKHSISFSLPFLVFFFWGLFTINQYHWPLWLIAVVGAVATAFFWQAYHYDFSRSKETKADTETANVLFVVIAVSGALAPLIGGLIATLYGANLLFGVVTGLVLVTIFPLFVKKEPHNKHEIHLRETMNKGILKEQLAYGGNAIEMGSSLIIWPLFIFFFLGSYALVGLVTSSALVVALLVTFLFGRIAEQRSKNYFISTGSFLTAAISFLRVLAYSLSTALLINVIRAIAHAIYESPFVAKYYLFADEVNKPEYIFWMEFGADIFRVVYFGLLVILSFYVSGSSLLAWALIIGAAATFLMAFMPQSKNEVDAIN